MRARMILMFSWLGILFFLFSGAAFGRETLTPLESVERGAAPDGLPRQPRWSNDGALLLFFAPARTAHAPSDLMGFSASDGKTITVISQERFRAALSKLEQFSKEDLSGASFYEATPAGTEGRFLLSSASGLFLWENASSGLKLLLAKEEEARNPSISPDGKWLAFASHGSLKLLDISSGVARTLAEGREPDILCGAPDWLYGEELDMGTAFWWSPDSSRIAFLKFDESAVPSYPVPDLTEKHPGASLQKYPLPGDPNPLVSLGVAPVDGGPTIWIPEAVSGDGYLPRVTWSLDGRALFFELLNREQDRLEIKSIEMASGAVTPVLSEESHSWVNVADGPKFLKDGSFIWQSERDGHARLYLCGKDGKVISAVTPAGWDVDELLGVDEKRGLVYFSSGGDNPIGQNLYRSSLRQGKAEMLSDGRGWHEPLVSPNFSWWLDRASTAAAPPLWSLRPLGRGTVREVASAARDDIRRFGFVAPEFVTVKGASDDLLHGKLYKPRDFDPSRKYPLILDVYGGPHAQMVQDRWGGRWEYTAQLFAGNGFAVFTIDNRGSARRGSAFEAPLLRRLGKVELEDQLAGIAYVKSLNFVDASRIGVWGWSYGGFMTLYSIANAPKGTFAAGVAVAPVTDWMNYDSCYTERYLKLPKENAGGYRDSSPLFSAAGFTAPVLIAQGLCDDNVHFGNSAQMVDALLKAGKPFTTAYYPRMDHGIREKQDRADLFSRILDFFELHLKPVERQSGD